MKMKVRIDFLKKITFFHFLFRPIGLPVLRKVRVHNLNAQSSIQMLSISGNTIHFHCSFFTDKVNQSQNYIIYVHMNAVVMVLFFD